MRRLRLIILSVVFLGTTAARISADTSFFDNYVFQSWISFGSLNGTSTTDIIQTKDGFINIGTYEGLARFDGMTFQTHKRTATNNLSFVSARAILEDSRGNYG